MVDLLAGSPKSSGRRRPRRESRKLGVLLRLTAYPVVGIEGRYLFAAELGIPLLPTSEDTL